MRGCPLPKNDEEMDCEYSSLGLELLMVSVKEFFTAFALLVYVSSVVGRFFNGDGVSGDPGTATFLVKGTNSTQFQT